MAISLETRNRAISQCLVSRDPSQVQNQALRLLQNHSRINRPYYSNSPFLADVSAMGASVFFQMR